LYFILLRDEHRLQGAEKKLIVGLVAQAASYRQGAMFKRFQGVESWRWLLPRRSSLQSKTIWVFRFSPLSPNVSAPGHATGTSGLSYDLTVRMQQTPESRRALISGIMHNVLVQ
jgi:hypothetical protein